MCSIFAFAPGTGTPEAGGLSSRELLALLDGLAELELRVAGADVVEVSPPYDPAGTTAVAAANAAYELVGLLALTGRREVVPGVGVEHLREDLPHQPRRDPARVVDRA
jgi:hypothetical protein